MRESCATYILARRRVGTKHATFAVGRQRSYMRTPKWSGTTEAVLCKTSSPDQIWRSHKTNAPIIWTAKTTTQDDRLRNALANPEANAIKRSDQLPKIIPDLPVVFTRTKATSGPTVPARSRMVAVYAIRPSEPCDLAWITKTGKAGSE